MRALWLVFVLGAALWSGRTFVDDPAEPYLNGWLLGYGFLGWLAPVAWGVPLPVGFPLALVLCARTRRNRGARRAAATAGFGFWLLETVFGLF